MTKHDNMIPAVFAKDGAVYANSRDVAAFFGKRHADVLRAIDGLECSSSFTERNFALSEYMDSTGRKLRSVDMTKDGFVFLVMGFTGQEAARFKEAYINAFNAMEKELAEYDEDQAVVPQTPEAEARMLVGEARRSFGAKAAQQLWGKLGLPVVPAMLMPEPQMEMSFMVALTAANTNRLVA